jgi:hypothetical protein
MQKDPTRTASTVPAPDSRVLERFPAGHPRGSWPAEEFAAARRNEGTPAVVVMDLHTDEYVLKAVAA